MTIPKVFYRRERVPVGTGRIVKGRFVSLDPNKPHYYYKIYHKSGNGKIEIHTNAPTKKAAIEAIKRIKIDYEKTAIGRARWQKLSPAQRKIASNEANIINSPFSEMLGWKTSKGNLTKIGREIAKGDNLK
jgi:hypothetical protein